MNSSGPYSSNSQKCRQWLPLITQQFRLRHLSQVIGMNLSVAKENELYFTLHTTVMSAPFYTSKIVSGKSTKWLEIDNRNFTNLSTSAVVIRIWLHTPSTEMDSVLLTWGINFTGLFHIGNKMSDIKPADFKQNAVIFYLNGGYFTSYDLLKANPPESLPSIKYKRMRIKITKNEDILSYDVTKLRNLHMLQLRIKERTSDVQELKEDINAKYDSSRGPEDLSSKVSNISPSIRYEPQLLTMNSLHRMMQDKPTKIDRQRIIACLKDVEVARFKNRLLSQEMDRRLASLRYLRKELSSVVEAKEERESEVMSNYHMLSKEADRMKRYKLAVIQYREILAHTNNQLIHRRMQLLKQLLFIYPIKYQEEKYFINVTHLPNSDVLADYSDTGLSVALGYVAHVLMMCAILMEIPLRYPIKHFGSRSSIIDNISPFINDKDREFPLFNRGKEKIQFIYAVYLLNKNIAQLRWLFFMHTVDLRATLPNLMSFLSNDKTYIQESVSVLQDKLAEKSEETQLRIVEQTRKYDSSLSEQRIPDLQCFTKHLLIPDPLLDCIKTENKKETSTYVTQKHNKHVENIEGAIGFGLTDILSIPETFLNEQKSSKVFKNFMEPVHHESENRTLVKSSLNIGLSYNGSNYDKKSAINCDNAALKDIDISLPKLPEVKNYSESRDDSASIDVNKPSYKTLRQDLRGRFIQQKRKKPHKHVSRSEGSYTDDDISFDPKIKLDATSDPSLNSLLNSQESFATSPLLLNELETLQDGQQEFLQSWLNDKQTFICSDESLCTDQTPATISPIPLEATPQDSPLMARTDALLKTKSFNLVKSKQ